ncbi:MAG: hypothetical protein HQ564_09345 [Candidatus Saganbacteria bacterium]|nr:hypothetical protein [Candidatus Saganbacteria bacterium]
MPNFKLISFEVEEVVDLSDNDFDWQQEDKKQVTVSGLRLSGFPMATPLIGHKLDPLNFELIELLQTFGFLEQFLKVLDCVTLISFVDPMEKELNTLFSSKKILREEIISKYIARIRYFATKKNHKLASLFVNSREALKRGRE